MDTESALPARSRLVQEHLEGAGIFAEIRELPESTRTAAEAANALGCDVGAIASSLLFFADDEPLLVIASGRHRVDTSLLATQIGAARIEMATAKQVRAVTGQAIGGVAPAGHPTPIRTVLDTALGRHGTVWAAAGTPHTVMPLTVDELITLTGGTAVTVAPD